MIILPPFYSRSTQRLVGLLEATNSHQGLRAGALNCGCGDCEQSAEPAGIDFIGHRGTF